MDHRKVLHIMYDAFKSLTVSNIEVLENEDSFIRVRVVAEGYANRSTPERIELLVTMLRAASPELSLNYAISWDPLTPKESSEFFGQGALKNKTSGDNSEAAASPAKNLDL